MGLTILLFFLVILLLFDNTYMIFLAILGEIVLCAVTRIVAIGIESKGSKKRKYYLLEK